MSGRVPYLLVDERGATLFEPKHIFSALKLDQDKKYRLQDFPCIGAHERVLPRKPAPTSSKLGYRRRYISPELIGRGIYGSHDNLRNPHDIMRSESTLSRDFTGPRA